MNGLNAERLIVFAVSSFLLSLVFVPIVRHLAFRYKWFDKPDHRKIHQYPIPRLGGIGIFGGFFITSVIFIISDSNTTVVLNKFTAFLTGCFIMFAIGLFDDLYGMNARRKFPVQFVAALIAYFAGFKIGRLDLPFVGIIEAGLFSLPLTLLWIVGVTNAINLIDGINGLAGGVSAIASFFIGLIAFQFGHPEIALLSWSLMAAIIGFLPYNVRDGKIFMGDSGSLVIGYVLSILSISATMHEGHNVSFFIPVVILGLPVMDTLISMFRRIVRGRAVFSADLNHVHHRLLSRLICPQKTMFALWVISALLGLVALFISYKVRYFSAVAVVMMGFVGVLSVIRFGNGEIKEVFHRTFKTGRRKRTPWYKNKTVHRVSQRIADAKNISHIYRILTLAGRELEIDLIRLNVLLNPDNGKEGMIRFNWEQKASSVRSYHSNGAPLWLMQYNLHLDKLFYGTLVYGKAEWKRRRKSEEDEIWVMEIGKSIHDWLVRAMQEGMIEISVRETALEKEEVATV